MTLPNQKQIEIIPIGNDYSSANVIKAGVVFFSTTISYVILNLFNLTGSSARTLDQKEKQEAEDSVGFSIALSNKRNIEGVQAKLIQPITSSLIQLDGTNGFSVAGLAGGNLGSSVSTAGDVNGDGFSDVVLGAPGASSSAVYILFGKASGWPVTFDLTTLNGTDGFKVTGLANPVNGYFSAYSFSANSPISTAGDVNGDGISDVVLGASSASSGGVVYILFGKKSGWSAMFNLSTLNGSDGFSVVGLAKVGSFNSNLGSSVSTAGDVNADGISDVVLGAPVASTVYVLFGKSSGWPAVFNVTTLNGNNGFSIPKYAVLGSSVSTAGDVNGDGISDLVLGDYDYYYNTLGAAYILFGKAGGWPAVFDLTTLDGTNGFSVVSGITNDNLGYSVSTAGDVNGDGISDVVLGAPGLSSLSSNRPGAAYVIFGKISGWPAMFNVTTLNGNNGFSVPGLSAGDQLVYLSKQQVI